MSSPPSRIPEADWLATPASDRTLFLAQQQEIQSLRQENDQLRSQLTALASELAQLRERIGRSSRNSSKSLRKKPPERPRFSLPRADHAPMGRTIVMNLLRRGGYRSIRQGLRELAYDIKGMLALGGVMLAASES